MKRNTKNTIEYIWTVDYSIIFTVLGFALGWLAKTTW